jgi:hypothetical protein
MNPYDASQPRHGLHAIHPTPLRRHIRHDLASVPRLLLSDSDRSGSACDWWQPNQVSGVLPEDFW